MNTPRRKLELLFSDIDFGTKEYGFLPRSVPASQACDGIDCMVCDGVGCVDDDEECLSEDKRYLEHLLDHPVASWLDPKVSNGVVDIEEEDRPE